MSRTGKFIETEVDLIVKDYEKTGWEEDNFLSGVRKMFWN
jgi:hypothetical protein